MLVLRPDYYDKFECIGDKCPNTCCAGWNVSIDSETYEKYKKLDTEYGKFVFDTIVESQEFGHVFKMDNMGRCSHLDNNGLCNIYSKISKEYMCQTCKIYPRRVSKYKNDIYEADMVASCPVVAKSIVSCNEKKLTFLLDEYELKDFEQKSVITIDGDYDEDYYDFAFQVRSDIIDIFQLDNCSINEKCMMILVYSKNAQKIVHEYNNWQQKLKAVQDAVFSNELKELAINTIKYSIEDKIRFLRKFIDEALETKKYTIINIITEYINNLDFKDLLSSYKSELEFSMYLNKQYPNLYENYMVYLSFKQIPNVFNHNNIEIEVEFVLLSLVVIQTMLYNEWNKNNKILMQDQVEKVIYEYSRFMEHNQGELYRLLKMVSDQNSDIYNFVKIIM